MIAIDTHILMDDGSYKLVQNIEVGDKIMAWDGDGFVSDEVRNVWESGEREIIQISHAGMPEVYVSHDQLFACALYAKSTTVWKPALGIADLDFVFGYGGASCGDKIDPLWAEFLGYHIFGGASPDNYDIKHRRYESLRLLLYDRDKVMPEKALVDLLADKRLILCAFSLERESLLAFMGAIISLRGRIVIVRSAYFKSHFDYRNPVISLELILYCTEPMAWNFYWLLRKLGVSARPPCMKELKWSIKIGRAEDIKTLFAAGNIVGHDQSMAEAMNAMKMAKSERGRKLYHGCFRTRVKRHKVDMRMTYGIETVGHHNYVANGYVVHD